MHVQVDASATVADGHSIAELVERAVADHFEQVVDVIVHLEPLDEYQRSKTVAEHLEAPAAPIEGPDTP